MNKKEELTGQPTLGQQKVIESEAIEKSEKGDKSYRKVYRPIGNLVTCYDCGVFQDLRLVTDERKYSFKRAGHKKNRNRVAILDNEGNHVHMCMSCIKKRATG